MAPTTEVTIPLRLHNAYVQLAAVATVVASLPRSSENQRALGDAVRALAEVADPTEGEAP